MSVDVSKFMADADRAVAALKNFCSSAMAYVSVQSLDSAGKDAIMGNLRRDYVRIEEDLDFRLRALVVNGELSPERWQGVATAVWDDIRAQSGYAREYDSSLAASFRYTISTTSKDVGTLIEEHAPSSTQTILVIALVAVALVSLAVIKVA